MSGAAENVAPIGTPDSVPDTSSALDFLTNGENDALGRMVVQLLAGYLPTPIAVAIVDLGIPGLLAGAGRALTAQEVAAAAGADPDATARLLRAGMAIGLVTADSSGGFSLTEMGKRLGPGAGSIGELAGLWMAPIREAMAGLAEHVRTGRHVDPAGPGGFWEYFGSHPAEVAKFSRAMGSATARVLMGLTAAGYRPPPCRRIVDVGGNKGTVLAWLLKAVPEAGGVVFDRPESLVAAPDFLASEGVADRAEIVAGTFFAEVPDGDLHVLSRVLHNWDDESVRRIVGNCAKAARPGGSLVLIEYVLPSVPEPTVGHLMDILMMVLYGGRERTVEEHRALVEPAGYTFIRDVPVGSTGDQQPPVRVLEFRRD